MSDPITVLPIARGSGDYLRALHDVLEVPFTPEGPIDARVDDLLAAAAEGVARIDLLFGAFQGGRLLAPVLAVESNGGAALVLAPSHQIDARMRTGTEMALARLRQTAFLQGTEMLQAVVPPEADGLQGALKAVGFRCLTTLIYLACRTGDLPTLASCRQDLTWMSYRPEIEDLFLEALERSYIDTLDCPELVGLRSTRNALSGHRSRRGFDPQHWWVALRGSEPVGVVLLGTIGLEPGLEIVYLGVSPESRGRGVVDALMLRTAEVARSSGVKYVTLAVDERNVPARKMYERFNYRGTLKRQAWIATPDGI
ncbi:MAG: GNAT family N-acetyltransferase [Phycisphaerae bacterium]